MISFNTIPLDIRAPGRYIEIDDSQAVRGLAVPRRKVLICGQKLAAGSATAGVPVQFRTASDAIALCGRGSMLARAAKLFRQSDPNSEAWLMPLSDLGGGTAAQGTITYTGPSTAAGTLPLWIAGQQLQVAVISGMTATQVATAVAAAITAATDLPVTATPAAGVVTWSARHKGTLGNSIDVRSTYQPTDAVPAGLTVAIAATTVGSGDPDGSVIFTTVGQTPFTDYVWCWNDATNLTNLEAGLLSRWTYDEMIDPLGWYAAAGSFSTVTTLGTARNSQFASFVGVRNGLNPPWEVAGWWGAVNGLALSIDPARPTQTLPAPGILAPAIADRWTRDERDLLLRDGVSTFVVDSGGNVMVDRAITTKQTDSNSVPTVAWLDINVPALNAFYSYSLRSRIASKFPRHKLANDGTPFSAGQPMVTPKILRGETIAWGTDLANAGLIEDLPGFIASLAVERDANDVSRANARVGPNQVNGFRVFAGQIQYIL